jgi:putative tryptophan/tyrosine transport system substrate-binding protein
VNRRTFIAGLGGVAAWPVVARAQQPAMPVIGFLNSGSPAPATDQVEAFRQGLKENGFLIGQNVTLDLRWAEGRFDRLEGLATDLVSQKVAVIFAGGPPAAMAAKSATSTIPVVFTSGDDPVQIGLVASLGHPGGNVTGVSILLREIQAKRLELLHELIPSASIVGLLAHSRSSNDDTETAARSIGLKLYTAHIASENALDQAFAVFAAHRVAAVLIGSDPAFAAWRRQIFALASSAGLPTVCETRGFAADGCLMTYGADVSDAYRQAATLVARIIKGEKPADLPVMQPTKFDLVINLKSAKTFGLTVPPSLLARADEVIE